MTTRRRISLIMFLTLVPVTLLVPGLHELVVTRYGGSPGDAHAFMTVNMVAGVGGVPLVMRLLRRFPDVRRWLLSLLLVDALTFVAMGFAPTLPVLLVLRGLDGLAHLPAITLLIIAANRLAGERRGASLGLLASALMFGVTLGSPLGGWLVERGPLWVYASGGLFFVAAAAVSAGLTAVPAAAGPLGQRYIWNRRAPETWVPLGYAFMDRFSIGIFVSTFTLFLASEHGLSAAARGVLVATFMLPFSLLCYPAARLAEARGWLAPMVIGNIIFGLTYASYGVVPRALLPVAMVLSGVSSALIFAPSFLLVSDLVKRGNGEGLFGAFQVAGSLGFLAGPIVGGVLVTITGRNGERPDYEAIFVAVGVLEFVLAAASYLVLRRVASEMRRPGELLAGSAP
jgi:MFS family permease